MLPRLVLNSWAVQGRSSALVSQVAGTIDAHHCTSWVCSFCRTFSLESLEELSVVLIPDLRKLRQEDCEFEASLAYKKRIMKIFTCTFSLNLNSFR
jgi:hypothetical protein